MSELTYLCYALYLVQLFLAKLDGDNNSRANGEVEVDADLDERRKEEKKEEIRQAIGIK